MACMCGDICCSSCGPAQGNYKCLACGAWASDGGCADPETCARSNAEMDEAEAMLDAEISAAAEQFWREHPYG